MSKLVLTPGVVQQLAVARWSGGVGSGCGATAGCGSITQTGGSPPPDPWTDLPGFYDCEAQGKVTSPWGTCCSPRPTTPLDPLGGGGGAHPLGRGSFPLGVDVGNFVASLGLDLEPKYGFFEPETYPLPDWAGRPSGGQERLLSAAVEVLTSGRSRDILRMIGDLFLDSLSPFVEEVGQA